MQHEKQEWQCPQCKTYPMADGKGNLLHVHKFGCNYPPHLIPRHQFYHPNQRIEAARREIARRIEIDNPYLCKFCNQTFTKVINRFRHEEICRQLPL